MSIFGDEYLSLKKEFAGEYYASII